MPPERRSGPPPKEAAPKPTATQSSRDTDSIATTAPCCTCWERRSDAAARLPLLDCGCDTADPWLCRCHPMPLSEHQLDGWALAASYILETTGHPPVLPVDVLRRLYRRGGDDRALAVKVHNATRGAVA